MTVKLRPLEREDLHFVHQLDNNASVMRYWFEEPYEAFVELSDLYDKHIHDQTERRFVVEYEEEKAGLVELVEINHVHRRAPGLILYRKAGALRNGVNFYRLRVCTDNSGAAA